MNVQNLVSKILASDVFAGETAKIRKSDTRNSAQMASKPADIPASQCRTTLVEIIQETTAASDVTLAGRQFALNMTLRNGQLFSFRILQKKSSTVWMHFFGPKTIFDAAKGAYNATAIQREINAAINNFSLFSDTCQITVKPIKTDCQYLDGLDTEFLSAQNRSFNLQDVNPTTANRPARIDYTANRTGRDQKPVPTNASLPPAELPKAAGAERMVALLKDSIQSPNRDQNNGALLLNQPVRQGAEKTARMPVSQDSRPKIELKPVYQHRQRLHLS
jgi:hypothetical protein